MVVYVCVLSFGVSCENAQVEILILVLSKNRLSFWKKNWLSDLGFACRWMPLSAKLA